MPSVVVGRLLRVPGRAAGEQDPRQHQCEPAADPSSRDLRAHRSPRVPVSAHILANPGPMMQEVSCIERPARRETWCHGPHSPGPPHPLRRRRSGHSPPTTFFTEVLPPLLERHGALVADGSSPSSPHRSPSRSATGRGPSPPRATPLVAREGTADDAVIVTLDEAAVLGLGPAAALVQRHGGHAGAAVPRRHDPGRLHLGALTHTLLEGWPVTDDDLDLRRSPWRAPGPGAVLRARRRPRRHRPLPPRGRLPPPAGLAGPRRHGDHRRGHRRGAVPAYTEGDGKSWWAVLADGTRRCVRLQEFLEHSPTTVAMLEGDRWEQLRRTIAATTT